MQKGKRFTSLFLVLALLMVCIGLLIPAWAEDSLSVNSGWNITSPMSIARECPAVFDNAGYLYAIGGYKVDYVNTVERAPINADLSLGQWTTLDPFSSTIGRAGVVKCGDYVYLIGGVVNSSPSNVVYKAKMKTDGSLSEWSIESTTMNIARADMGVVVVNGYVYAIGGASGMNRVNSVEYTKINEDGTLGAWQFTSNMNVSRWKNHAVTGNGYIYVVGGVRPDDVYERNIECAKVNTDGTLGAWTLTNIYIPAAGAMQAVSKEGYLYVIGGSDGTNPYYKTVLKAQMTANGGLGEWQSVEPMNYGRAWHGAYATDSSIYVLGGRMVDSSFSNSVEFLANESVASTASTWTFATTTLNKGREAFSLIPAKGYLYALGGVADYYSNWLKTIERAPINADGSVGTWTNIGNLPGNWAHGSALLINDNIYIVGGQPCEGGDSNIVYKAQVNSDGSLGAWVSLNSMPNSIVDPGVVYVNGYLYVLGGAHFGGYARDVYRAQVNTDGTLGTWTTLNPMNNGRFHCYAKYYNGYIYAINGAPCAERAQLNADGTLGTWTAVGNNLSTINNSFVASLGNKVYSIAGTNSSSVYTKNVERAEIGEDGSLSSWENDLPINVYRVWSGACEYNGVLYAAGGKAPTMEQLATVEYYVVSLSTSTTIENTAPAAPTGLSASAGNMQVGLTWNANNESDLAGYNLYRRQNGGSYAKLNSSILTNTSYTDNGLTNGETYYYVVKAVDSEGLESEASNEVHAIPAGSWLQTAKVYWMPVFGWSYSMVGLNNITDDTVDFEVTLYNNSGVQVGSASGKVNPHASWNSLPELGNLYEINNPVVCKVIASAELRVTASEWGKCADSVWEYDVEEVGTAATYDFWMLAAKYNQSIINIANPNDTVATVTLTAYGNDGAIIKTKNVTVPAHGMMADLDIRNSLASQATPVRIQSDIPVVISAGSFSSDGSNGKELGISPRSRIFKKN
jgi:N-acetylneuraminic acid mutarotase